MRRILKAARIVLLAGALVFAMYYFTTPWLEGPSEWVITPETDVWRVWTEQLQYSPGQRKIVFYVRNCSQDHVEYNIGELERLHDGVWHKLKERPHWETANHLTVLPGEMERFSPELDPYGPRLKPGEYRLILHNYTHKITSAVEFEVK